MERVQRLDRLWSWLPAFRAVAETQNLHRAAQLLHVAPSALSRSIRLLEEDVGRALFDRVGRRIVLNAKGEEFLGVVRDAMRWVDEGLSTITASDPAGTVRIACTEYMALVCVLPALERLRRDHARLAPQLRIGGFDDAGALLLRGELDVAFVHIAPHGSNLQIEPVAEVTSSVWCGPGHPLYRARRRTLAQVLDHAFVVHADQRDGDGWPAELGRKVRLRVPGVHLAATVCARGELLAVLPDALPERSALRLRRIALDVMAPARVYAARRAPLGARGPAELVIEAVRAISANSQFEKL